MERARTVVDELRERLPDVELVEQQASDDMPTLWVGSERVADVLRCLKADVTQPYKMLFDLTAIDERTRRVPAQQPESDFTVAYTLLSMDRNDFIRLKVPLQGEYPSIGTVTGIFPNANWYEREVWDMFGIKVEGHPNLTRILSPPGWVGHPLRKEHPARATEMEPYLLPQEKQEEEEVLLQVDPEYYGLKATGKDVDYMVLNFGPHHPGTHGLLRMVLQLDGEQIVDSAMDIGWHHRARREDG